ncbi:MAG: carboxypeptidase-like regulatory domain-containing protein [Prevotella sp.]|jgi:hypothetical protein|nr:carboxypeptidase-like regulatory domain-containing protein [Prevotella sp.]
MKTNYLKIARIVLVALFIFSTTVPAHARKDPGYITVSGVVKDLKSRKNLEYVSISIPGTGIGTISNEDGGFSIKVKDSLRIKTLEISHIGYYNKRIHITDDDMDNIIILLTPNEKKLKEVIIESGDPLKLVENAILKIGDNYSNVTNQLTGFYRETIRKRRNYINISEAIINVYKTSYTEGDTDDRVQVLKGRKLLSPKPGDTLLIKFIGGPNLSSYLDVVKNKDIILNLETLRYYKFTMEDPAMINERPHFVVSFIPQVILPYALFTGNLYIDKETLAFSRAEFYLSMDDRNKATQAILRKKPFSLRFKPEEVSYLVTYKEQGGKSYLNYIRNEVRFKCDYQRKLFSTNYTIVSEMVITDKNENNVAKISYKQAFDNRNSLSDKVSNFYDVDFWEDYNIIEPTESLESAVNKLKKQQNN